MKYIALIMEVLAMRRRIISFIYILVLGISLGINAYPSWAMEILNLGHEFPPESSVGKGAERFADLVKTKSDGEVIIKVFPSGTQGSISQLMEMVQGGFIDLAIIPIWLLATLDARVGVLELPFLFFSYNEADQFLEGKVGKSILRILSGKRVRGLCYFELGFLGIASKERPINKVEDYKGLRIRIGSLETVESSIRLLGAQPVRLPIGEVYVALQRGLADATLTTVSDYSFFKYYEILPFLSLTNHFYASHILIMNRTKLDRLPQKFQEILYAAAMESSKDQRDLSRQAEEKILKKIEGKGVEVVTAPDKKSMKNSVQPIYEKTKERLGCKDCKTFPWCCLW